jgi:hypothetical protein
MMRPRPEVNTTMNDTSYNNESDDGDTTDDEHLKKLL